MYGNVLFGIAGLMLIVSCSNPFLPPPPKNIAKGYVDEAITDAKSSIPIPKITTPLVQGPDYYTNETPGSLTVAATVKDGTLTYQWYSNTTSKTNGTAIPSETGTSFQPPAPVPPLSDAVGTTYYYVIVTNSFNGKKSKAVSNVVMVTIKAIDAAIPIVNLTPTPPAGDSYAQGQSVTISANASADAVAGVPASLTYQWYSNTVDNNTSLLNPIIGATGATYNPPTALKGITHYFVVVTNSITDNGDGGTKTATVTSDAVQINVGISMVEITGGLTVDTKTYDGTTAATYTGTLPTLSGVAFGDDVYVIGAGTSGTLVFANANAGTDFVTLTGTWVLGGSNSGDYALSTTTGIPGTITPAPITISNIDTTGSRTLIPFGTTDAGYGTSATFTVDISGFVGADTATVDLVGNSYGLSLSTNTTGNGTGTSLTINYNGTPVPASTVTTNLRITGNGNYEINGTPSVTVNVNDGVTNPISVTPTNITAFNTYANTTDGRWKSYELTDDVTLTGNWTAIGTTTNPFIGTFDGGSKTINFNNITTSNGMFGIIDTGGIVQNVTLDNVNIIISGAYVGGVAGSNAGTVENCSVTGTITGADDFVGGVVGYNNGGTGTVQNCSVTGAVTVTGDNIGGVVGENNGGTVLNCYTTGAVSGINNVGGVAGRNAGTVEKCYATGDVEGNQNVGGVAGRNDGGGVEDCVALNENIVANIGLGRVVGSSTGGHVNNYARDDMEDGTGNSFIVSDDVPNGIDGGDVTAGSNPGQTPEEYNDQTFWQTTLDWNFTTVWFWNGTLPELR